MAGNDLLNGFQAGMQAFAPLVNATLQRKKDERDTAARMNELRLQSELQGSRDATLNQYGVARDANQMDFTTGRDATLNANQVTAAATLNANQVTAAAEAARVRSQENKVTMNHQDRIRVHEGDARIAAALLAQTNLSAAERTKAEATVLAAKTAADTETKLMLAKLRATGSQSATTLADMAQQLKRAERIGTDNVSSVEAKDEAASLAWAIRTDLTMKADAFNAILTGAGKSGNPQGVFDYMDKFNASLPGFAPKPTAPKTYTLTDSLTGEQQVYMPVEGPNGTELKRVPKEGAAPAAPGTPGAFGSKPKTPAGKGAGTPVVPTSKYWNAPPPATR